MHIESILKKLRYKENIQAVVLNAPADIEQQFVSAGLSSALPKNQKAAFCLLFARNWAEIESHVHKVAENTDHKGLIWLAYPKLTSKIKSDINRDNLWPAFETYNLRPVSLIAIDETWSAMRFMIPKK